MTQPRTQRARPTRRQGAASPEQPPDNPEPSANPPAVINQSGETALARPRAVAGLIPPGTPYSHEGFDDDRSSGIAGRYLRIVQANSEPVKGQWKDDDGNSWLGQFYVSGTDRDADPDEESEFNDPRQILTLVPLAGAAKRQRWVEKDDKTRVVQCQAIGPKFSILIGRGSPGGSCKECPLSQWQTDEKGNRYVLCDKVYSYVVWVVEWEMVCIWDLSKTSNLLGMSVHDWLTTRGGGNPAGAYTNCAIQVQTTEVSAVKYDTTHPMECMIAEDAKITREGRRKITGHTWYLPEAYMLEGTLEDNNINLPESGGVLVGVEEIPEDDDNELPF